MKYPMLFACLCLFLFSCSRRGSESAAVGTNPNNQVNTTGALFSDGFDYSGDITTAPEANSAWLEFTVAGAQHPIATSGFIKTDENDPNVTMTALWSNLTTIDLKENYTQMDVERNNSITTMPDTHDLDAMLVTRFSFDLSSLIVCYLGHTGTGTDPVDYHYFVKVASPLGGGSSTAEVASSIGIVTPVQFGCETKTVNGQLEVTAQLATDLSQGIETSATLTTALPGNNAQYVGFSVPNKGLSKIKSFGVWSSNPN